MDSPQGSKNIAGIEPGPDRWQRCAAPLDRGCHAKFLQPLRGPRRPAVKDLAPGCGLPRLRILALPTELSRLYWTKENCRDPGSSRGPSDLQSDALPTELSRPCQSHSKHISLTALSILWLQGCTSSHVSLDEALPAEGGGRRCSTALYREWQAARRPVRLETTPIQRDGALGHRLRPWLYRGMMRLWSCDGWKPYCKSHPEVKLQPCYGSAAKLFHWCTALDNFSARLKRTAVMS